MTDPAVDDAESATTSIEKAQRFDAAKEELLEARAALGEALEDLHAAGAPQKLLANICYQRDQLEQYAEWTEEEVSRRVPKVVD